jgi:hypothetical protein
MSLYIKENCFNFLGETYERLYDHPMNERYRIIFNEDDYDYIEDEELISELDTAF